jgi:hypothetical protein
MRAVIPKPLKLEHDELHATLAEAVSVKGEVGVCAKAVAHVLHDHFLKEEEYALPPLGSLAAVAAGNILPEMAEVLVMTEKLRADLPHMLEEHKAIVAELEKLIVAAKKADRPEYVVFSEKLMLHAQTEEEVMYPAAILVGEYLKLKLQNSPEGRY